MTKANLTKTLSFRWLVFLLALGFWLYQFTQTNLSAFGWQFRFLTIWALSANLIVAAQMLRLSLGKTRSDWNPLVSAVVVVNAFVVLFYWRLWFIDPSLINSNGPIPWFQEYYLHALGPLLMVIDAFFILGVFRRMLPTAGFILVIILAYVLWIEGPVGFLNSFPEGKFAHGLPYPFLNNMDWPDRMSFYATTVITAAVYLLIGWVVSKIIVRFG